MRAGTLLIAGLIVFGLLSLTDYAQTFALIEHGNGEVIESNPVASAWLERYGWPGLAVFKAGSVIVFATAAVLVWRRRPRAGVGMAAVGCAALLAVTNYSHGLLIQPREVAGNMTPALSDLTHGTTISDPTGDPVGSQLGAWPPPPVPR
jgi:hypothetical protein